MSIQDYTFDLIGQVVIYGGGSVVIAYLIFQFLGKSWIEARFLQRLEAFKHQQQVELQRLKVGTERMLQERL